MFNKIKNILLWPFKVDNRGLKAVGFKASAAVLLFLVAACFILYKSISYYKFIYYDYIDAEQAVDDYFIQGNISIRQYDSSFFRMKSGAVNLHFNSIKEKPQIVTYIEGKPPHNEDIVKRANTLFNEIGIGSAEYNNGVLIYLAANNVSFKIEVGYGLEDVITDSIAGRILDKAIYNAGGKDNISELNISSVLLSIFTDIAEITAKKYNVDISEDLQIDSWDNIKYREARDTKAIFLQIFIISLSLFIMLLLLSKRYFIIMFVAPVLIVFAFILYSGGIFALIVGFFLYPLKSLKRINLTDKEYDNFLKTRQSSDVKEKQYEVVEVNDNLFSLMLIPPKNKSYFINMPYQFILFYSTLFLAVFLFIFYMISSIDYKPFKYFFIDNNNYTVKEKISLYTNAGDLKIYENVGNNTYKADDTFGKELYGINYIFRQHNINAPEIAVCAQINDNFNRVYDAQTCYKHFKLDKLLKENGLLIYYKFNVHEHSSELEMIAGSELKDIFTDDVIKNIKSNALQYAYNGVDKLNINDNTKIIGVNIDNKQILDTLLDVSKIQNNEQRKSGEQIDILRDIAKQDILINQLIRAYIYTGNAGKVLQTAVRDSANVIAKAYNININEDKDKLLSYYKRPYKTRLYTDLVNDMLKLAGSMLLFITAIILAVKFKQFRKILLYNIIIYVFILAYILKGKFYIIFLITFFIYMGVYMRSILSEKGYGSVDGNSGSRSGGFRLGGSFRSSGRSSSRSRSSGRRRSFRGGGRSGGGGAFRR